jgi:anti-sigma B factor antagonist
MEITETNSKDIWILKPNGSMDAHTSPNFKSKLEAGINSGKSKIIIDMQGITYLSSAGAGALLAGLTACKKKSGELRLCSFQAAVRDAFEVMGFSKAFKVFIDLEKALEGF